MQKSSGSEAMMPDEIGRAGARELRVRWRDGHESVYPERELRLACPCAECVDETTGRVRIIGSSIPADVRAIGANIVGQYGVSIEWSDGHRTGIYSFEGLRQACSCPACRRPGGCDFSGGEAAAGAQAGE
ncbi:MAG TPA: DUF971 domain-containing protein [bacterium]